jgi:hypothetical protein
LAFDRLYTAIVLSVTAHLERHADVVEHPQIAEAARAHASAGAEELLHGTEGVGRCV